MSNQKQSLSEKHSNDVADQANEKNVVNAPLTADSVVDNVTGLMDAANHVFFEVEQRALATNGKAYPLEYNFESAGLVDRSTGEPILDTGSIVSVNKYKFLSRSLCRSLCSGLEYQLQSQNKSIAEQRAKIANELRFGRNAGVDTEAKVSRMADFLGTMLEQAAMIEIAYKTAVERFYIEFDEVPVSRTEAKQQVKARLNSLDPATRSRLEALGISQDA